MQRVGDRGTAPKGYITLGNPSLGEEEAEGMESSKEWRPSGYNRVGAHVSSQGLRQHAQGRTGSALHGVLELKGEEGRCLHP